MILKDWKNRTCTFKVHKPSNLYVTYSPCNCELGPIHCEIYRCPLVGPCRHTCNQHSVGCPQLHRLHLLYSHPVTDIVNFFFLDRLMDNIISVVITGDVRASTIMKLKLCSRIRKYINGDWLLGRRDDKITILCRGKITFWVPGKHAKRTDRQTDRDRNIERYKQTNELIDRNPNVI